MATPSNVIGSSLVVPAGTLNAPCATEESVDVQAAGLEQARRVRDEALHLMCERFKQDLAFAAQLLGGKGPDGFVSEVEYANKLMADYLAESEKLFALIGRQDRMPDSPGEGRTQL